MTSLFPPGAGGKDPKGPVREPLHPDERDGSRYAPRPPSEREKEPDAREGIGVFRFAGCGLGVTIALVLLVGVVVLVGYLRDDPERNPAPAAYRTAICAAFGELDEGTRALERGVEESGGSDARAAAATEVEDHLAAANDALTDLPVWEPGRSLDELIGSLIITLTNGAVALAEESAESAGEDLESAREVGAFAREELAEGRYGFDCSG
ncbi:MAG: hypothetical protein ACRDG7_18625 [Candidatus Limnocylindria bacterium]